MGLDEPGLNRVIRAAYKLLGLQTYFTAGEKEVRAWTVQKGSTAPQAAGVIHTDFERGFIRAETVAYDDFIKYKGESGAQGCRTFASGRQGVLVQRRRRPALPLQCLKRPECAWIHIGHRRADCGIVALAVAVAEAIIELDEIRASHRTEPAAGIVRIAGPGVVPAGLGVEQVVDDQGYGRVVVDAIVH